MKFDRLIAYAYARGYYDARSEGIEINPYPSESLADMHQAYREGYDCGISDYCRDNHPEDEAA